MVFLLVIFGGLYLWNHQKEDITGKLMDATFSGDAELIMDLFPQKVRMRAIDDVSQVYGVDAEEVPDQIGADLKQWITNFNTMFGEGWTYSYEIKETHIYTKDELKNLNACYQAMGVQDFTADRAQIRMISYKITGKNGTAGENLIPVCLVKTEGKWYLGQNIGQAYEEWKEKEGVHYLIYGDLLDGFTPTGVVTESGEVIPFDYGTEEMEQETSEDTESVDVNVNVQQ